MVTYMAKLLLLALLVVACAPKSPIARMCESGGLIGQAIVDLDNATKAESLVGGEFDKTVDHANSELEAAADLLRSIDDDTYTTASTWIGLMSSVESLTAAVTSIRAGDVHTANALLVEATDLLVATAPPLPEACLSTLDFRGPTTPPDGS